MKREGRAEYHFCHCNFAFSEMARSGFHDAVQQHQQLRNKQRLKHTDEPFEETPSDGIFLVIDTNCLIVSIPKQNAEYWLYSAFRAGEFEWILSNEILSEYLEKLSAFYSPATADLVANILLTAPNVTLAAPFYKWGLISADPDDNKFADLAIAQNVDYLVSNDRHFQILKTHEFPLVPVVRLDEFRIISGY